MKRITADERKTLAYVKRIKEAYRQRVTETAAQLEVPMTREKTKGVFKDLTEKHLLRQNEDNSYEITEKGLDILRR